MTMMRWDPYRDENGMLTMTLPKAETVKPKQIKVKAKSAIEIAKK